MVNPLEHGRGAGRFFGASGGFAFAVGLSGLLALGCGEGGGEGTAPSFHYPLDNVIRLNHVQLKESHNSYHVEPEGNIYDGWRYTHAPLDVQLSEQGVRGLELDVHYNFALGYFRVFHTPPDPETTCERFVDCLSVIRGWSDAHPAHQPIVIVVEPKDTFGSLEPDEFVEKVEGEILSVWPRDRIVTPDFVQGDAPDLATAIATTGWPTLGRVRGRVLFALLWSEEGVKHYGSGSDRVMFAHSKIGDSYGAVAVLNSAETEAAAVEAHAKAGFLVRVMCDIDNVEALAGDTSRRDAALASAAHLLSTDYPVKVDGVDYWTEIPGGTPSRCNPVTAPAECTPEAIEDPKFIGE
jgi:hypothetical protein